MAIHRGRPLTSEHRAAIAAALKGKKLSETHVLAMKLAKRPPITDAQTANMSAAQKGKVLSLEHRRKIGDANRGKVRSPEVRTTLSLRAKARIARDGHRITPEMIAKGRAARAITKEMKALKQFIRYSCYRVNIETTEHRTAPGEKFTNAERQAMLGYSLQDLRAHIERQFHDGMTWENYGRSGWHIDHIIPIAKFMRDDVTDIRIIHALSNLQPLWARDNHAKHAKTA